MIYIFIVLICAFSLAVIFMADDDDNFKDTSNSNNSNYRSNYRVGDNKFSITLFFILLITLAVTILYVIVSESP